MYNNIGAMIMFERIRHISGNKPRNEKLKEFLKNWKSVILIALIALTLKVLAEQLALIFIRKFHQ